MLFAEHIHATIDTSFIIAEAGYFESNLSVHDPQNATKNQTSFRTNANHKTNEIACLKNKFFLLLIWACRGAWHSQQPHFFIHKAGHGVRRS